MRTFNLIKRELKSLFCHPFYLTVVSLLNIIPTIVFAIYLKINQTQSGYAGFENMISLMAVFFAVAIPVVTITAICREKKNGYENFLYSMPISKTQIVISKLISFVLFFAVPTAIIGIFPIAFAGYGVVNYLHCYLSLLMLLAFETFIIALSTMFAMKTGKLIKSLIFSYAILVFSFIVGVLSAIVRFIPLGTTFDKIFGGILLELSIFKKIDTVVNDVFDWTTLAFFIIGAIIFTVIATVKLKRKMLISCLSVCVAACIGILPLLLPYSVRQMDLSAEKLYTPSSSTQSTLSSVDEAITVYLIDPYTNEDELYNAIVRTLEKGKNIDLKIVNSAEDKDFLTKYQLESISVESLSYAMIVESSKRWTFINGQDYFCYYNKSMGYLDTEELQYRYTACASLLNQYSAYYDQLEDGSNLKTALQKASQIMQSLQSETYVCLQLEDSINNAVAYVTADMIPTVYFLSGHGEEGTTANPYDFKENATLPENADTIVINSPSEDYSEAEINTLIDYLDNGGKIYILTDVDNYSMSNFMRLLAHYGLSVENSAISVSDSTVISVSVNKEHEAFSAMSNSEVTVKSASKITVAENSEYTYSPMLSYKHTEGEGESATVTEYPIAISVSKGNENKITLFTGATTFNSSDSGLSEEQLERVSPCVTYVMSWMFDEFEADIISTPPKLYQKTLYIADDGQIAKSVVIFVAIALAITVSLSAYILSRSLRSKRGAKQNDFD